MVEFAWSYLLDESYLLADLGGDMDKYTDYVTVTWIEDPETGAALFPIALWNKWNAKDVRSNAFPEGYHSRYVYIYMYLFFMWLSPVLFKRLDKKIGAKPNFWKFVEGLQVEEESQRLRWTRLQSKTLKERNRNTADEERDARIRDNTIEYLLIPEAERLISTYLGQQNLIALLKKQSNLVAEFGEVE